MALSYISNKILISLLKKNGVKDLVLSSGTRNIPFISEVEVDPYFKCYSIVDERNAAFFALGLSQKKGNVPVVIACTSGTAVSNYLTGITEAFYSHAPIIIITCDRSPYVLNQLETQKIDQLSVFTSVTKKSVQLPVIKDDEDVWYCQRLVNEAFIAMTQYGTGPIHINVPFGGDTNQLNNAKYDDTFSDNVNYISYYSNRNYSKWSNALNKLIASNKVLIVMGQHLPLSLATKELIRKFTAVYKIPVLADNLCNFRCNEMVMAEGLIKALNRNTISPLLPEIVISFGQNFQERIKDLLKAHSGEFEHWLIDEDGKVKDVFRSQTALFECSPEEFFSYVLNNTGDMSKNSEYLDLWKKYESAISLPEMPWTNFYAVREFSKSIPNDSILHLAILNSTRLTQFFDLDETIEVYSNVNTFGIDGCLPTFIGQSVATDKLSFLLIGDLSFFYGMNAAAIKHLKNNVRILLLNNQGAAEFHIQPDCHNRPTVDLHIGCAHSLSAKGWIESLGYQYIAATDKETLAKGLREFVCDDSERPILLEVFTDMREDGPFLLSVYRHLEQKIAEMSE